VKGRRPPQFVRFLIVGGTAVGLNILLYATLVGLLEMPYLAATVIIFLVGNAYGFAVNRSWTFLQRDRPVSRLVLYYATMLASLGANLLSMFVLVDGFGFHYVLASVVTSIWLAPVLYLTHKQLAFGRPSAPPSTDVLLVTNYFPEHGGGVERVAHELSRRIGDGLETVWFASGPGAEVGAGHPRRVGIPAWNGIEDRTGLPIPIPTPVGIRHVVAGVRSARAVWIHDILYLSNIVAAATALVTRKPLLITVHIGMIPYRNPLIRGLMAALMAIVGSLILPNAQAVTFVSDRIRREFSARWKLRAAYLIPNGVDTSAFQPASKSEQRTTRARLRLGTEQIALFVGRFVERKGLHLLHDLARTMPGTTWVFAGEGPLNPEDWRLPNVRVLGHCSPEVVASLYGACDLAVLPSLGEGFPLVVQEALASGARVLIDPSTAAGYPEVERHLECEPVAGPTAVERWRSRILQIISEPESPSRRQARIEFARSHWSWDRSAGSYRQLLGSLVEGRYQAPSRVPASLD
jgi:glycosyltransferase involved in cell wall biosynthesis/putative flippase GtrA